MVVKVKSEVAKATLIAKVGDYNYASNGLKSKSTIFTSRFSSTKDTNVSTNKENREKIICEVSDDLMSISFYSVYALIEESVCASENEESKIISLTFKKELLLTYLYNKQYDELEETYCKVGLESPAILDEILPKLLQSYFDDFYCFITSIFMKSPAYEELSQMDNIQIEASCLFRIYVKKFNKHFGLLLVRNAYNILKTMFRATNFEVLNFTINKQILDLMDNNTFSLSLTDTTELLAKFNYNDIVKVAFVLEKIGKLETASEVLKRLVSSPVEDINGFMNYYLRNLMVLGNIEVGHDRRVYDHDFIVLYFDYLNMADRDDENFEPYPENLKEAHDRVMDNYLEVQQRKQKEETERKFNEARQLYQAFEWKKKIDGDEYEVIVPNSPDELNAESESMHNCVKTYIDKVCQKKCQICFMRRNGDCFLTIEVRDYAEIHQAKLAFNEIPSDDVKKIIKMWADEKELSIKYY